jgi:hypothetical protein
MHIGYRFNWAPLLFLSTCMIGYSLGIASIAIILSGEIIPIQIKNQTNGVINFFNKGFAYVALEAFHFTIEVLKPSGTFWMYAVCSFVLAVFFLVVLPETKGQTLHDIERRLTQASILGANSSSNGSTTSIATVGTCPGGMTTISATSVSFVVDEKAATKQDPIGGIISETSKESKDGSDRCR